MISPDTERIPESCNSRWYFFCNIICKKEVTRQSLIIHKLEYDEKCPVCGDFFKDLSISVYKFHQLAPGRSGEINCFWFFLNIE